jgi:hypothetical protein
MQPSHSPAKRLCKGPDQVDQCRVQLAGCSDRLDKVIQLHMCFNFFNCQGSSQAWQHQAGTAANCTSYIWQATCVVRDDTQGYDAARHAKQSVHEHLLHGTMWQPARSWQPWSGL